MGGYNDTRRGIIKVAAVNPTDRKREGAVSLRIHIDQGEDGKNTVRVFASANS